MPPPQLHHLHGLPPGYQQPPPGPPPSHHRGGPPQQLRPPPSRKGHYGAVRVAEFTRRYLPSDYTTVNCKLLGRYSVVITGHIARKYDFYESDAAIELKAHSVLNHCYGWREERRDRISEDTEEWKFIEEIEKEAKELTMQQLEDLTKDASERLGPKRLKHMAQMAKCSLFLRLGTSVALREWPRGGKDPIIYARGILQAIEGKRMWIGGKKCDIGPYDLATDYWTLDQDEDGDIMTEEGSLSSTLSTPSMVEASTVASKGKNFA